MRTHVPFKCRFEFEFTIDPTSPLSSKVHSLLDEGYILLLIFHSKKYLYMTTNMLTQLLTISILELILMQVMEMILEVCSVIINNFEIKSVLTKSCKKVVTSHHDFRTGLHR